MATIRFQVVSDLAPQAVLNALIDFSDRRPDLYRNIDRSHFRVHAQGPGWADVTEGNVLAWERSRYEWDAAAGTVTVKTTESDTWTSGSRWDYRLRPTPVGGTQVDVTVVRNARTLRGKLLTLGIPLVGVRLLRADLQNVLAHAR